MEVSNSYIFTVNRHTGVCWYDRRRAEDTAECDHLSVWQCDLKGLKDLLRKAIASDYYIHKGIPVY